MAFENRTRNWLGIKDSILRDGGMVHLPNPDDKQELIDFKYAIDSILIPEVTKRVKDFTPELDKNVEFYKAFFVAYLDILGREMEVAEKLADEKYETNDMSDPIYRAFLTMDLGFPESFVPSSLELFPTLAVFARKYENLLRDTLGSDFNIEIFFDNLRKYFPKLLLRLISMDDITNGIVILNARDESQKKSSNAFLDPDYHVRDNVLITDENGVPVMSPKFLELVKQHITQNNITTSNVGRIEDRRCPFLYAEGRDEYINFAIEELIRQYKKYHGL